MGSPSPETPYCRTCRRALNVHTSDGITVTYLHAVEQRGGRVDHQPDPAPITEIPDPIIDCDFCSTPGAGWIYRCANQSTDLRRVTTQVFSAGEYQNRHHAARVRRTDTEHAMTQVMGERWSACDGCAAYIEARDLYGLIGRVATTLPTKLTRGSRLAATRAQLHQIYSTMFDTLAPSRGQIVPGHPLGIWPDERDGGEPS